MQLAGIRPQLAEDDDAAAVMKKPDGEGSDAEPEAKPPFGQKPAAAKPAFGDKPAAPSSSKGLDSETKAERATQLAAAKNDRLEPNWIRASIKHLADRAYQQVAGGNKDISDIKSELQHHHDMIDANLRGLHRFPFVNPNASNEDKSHATDLFELASNLDKLLRGEGTNTGLGQKKASELGWLN
jgi:hypothetical protein